MKALSLWQPWAELVRRGLKQYETRDWPMPAWIFDKPLAIHAAQRPFNSAHCPAELRCQLLMDEVDLFMLRYGVVLCIVHPQKSVPAAEIAPSLSVECCHRRIPQGRVSTIHRCALSLRVWQG